MKYLLFTIIAIAVSACVSSSKYEKAVQERDAYMYARDSIKTEMAEIQKQMFLHSKEIEDLHQELMRIEEEKNILTDNATEGAKELLNRVDELKTDLKHREDRLEEIRKSLLEKEANLQLIRHSLENALLNFTESGLRVYIEDGKVHVAMSNKLLFSSGSISINNEGKEALTELSKVLAQNPELGILIEGHTDTQPVTAGHRFRDNWELSVLRATEVAKYLIEDGDIEPKRITAAGRSEYFPLNNEETSEAMAMNRRTEIVLIPKLEMLYEVMEQDIKR
ncbi:MAG: OmpA family protein [Bacteroidota bacterium]